jgi:hypothetical protein
MENELTFYGKIEEGRVIFNDPDYVKYRTKDWKVDNSIITISKQKPKRTLKQNNWYWGVCIPVIQAFLKEMWGEYLSKTEVHLYHLNHVTKPEVELVIVMGKQTVGYIQKRPSEMSTTEFNSFKDEVQVYWSLKGCVVPDPNQTDFL